VDGRDLPGDWRREKEGRIEQIKNREGLNNGGEECWKRE